MQYCGGGSSKKLNRTKFVYFRKLKQYDWQHSVLILYSVSTLYAPGKAALESTPTFASQAALSHSPYVSRYRQASRPLSIRHSNWTPSATDRPGPHSKVNADVNHPFRPEHILTVGIWKEFLAKQRLQVNIQVYQPESFPLAMRLVATSLIVLCEAPDERMLATRQALQSNMKENNTNSVTYWSHYSNLTTVQDLHIHISLSVLNSLLLMGQFCFRGVWDVAGTHLRQSVR